MSIKSQTLPKNEVLVITYKGRFEEVETWLFQSNRLS